MTTTKTRNCYTIPTRNSSTQQLCHTHLRNSYLLGAIAKAPPVTRRLLCYTLLSTRTDRMCRLRMCMRARASFRNSSLTRAIYISSSLRPAEGGDLSKLSRPQTCSLGGGVLGVTGEDIAARDDRSGLEFRCALPGERLVTGDGTLTARGDTATGSSIANPAFL